MSRAFKLFASSPKSLPTRFSKSLSMPRSMIRSMTRTMRRPGPSALTLLTLLVGTAIGALGVVSGAAAGPPGSLPPGAPRVLHTD